MTTSQIIEKINGGRAWAEGSHERIYIDIPHTPYAVCAIYVDVSGNATLGMYDYTEDTDCGSVVVVCSQALGRKNRSALQDAIWALLDN